MLLLFAFEPALDEFEVEASGFVRGIGEERLAQAPEGGLVAVRLRGGGAGVVGGASTSSGGLGGAEGVLKDGDGSLGAVGAARSARPRW
ncbi:MAG: hypothetical protein BRD52_00220 [Bacteroidetes bacterium SW_4_67_19]|nr:MAG: hypothetical protein BRD52_00220 [Bacteroidetes bacterium SW_4_67_19]